MPRLSRPRLRFSHFDQKKAAIVENEGGFAGAGRTSDTKLLPETGEPAESGKGKRPAQTAHPLGKERIEASLFW
jgi:hypothetical protein